MSTIAWIDFDRAERDRINKILDLFNSPDARDELGLGTIRDTLSDSMFPGVSAVQTRLRYMLFIPWIFKSAVKLPRDKRIGHVRKLEVKLIESLQAGGETKGIIGSTVLGKLKRPPYDIYWTGLRKLDILVDEGSPNEILMKDKLNDSWSPSLPEQPPELFDRTTFSLSRAEADFFCAKLESEASGSLWAELAQYGKSKECLHVWDHPRRHMWSKGNKTIIYHAELFARTMHGAALLYNLMLAEKSAEIHKFEDCNSESLVECYSGKLTSWECDVPVAEIDDWDISELWTLTTGPSHSINIQAIDFVKAWRDIVIRHKGKVTNCADARSLISARENGQKGSQARLRNDEALRAWGGASGANILTFRWDVAQDHMMDLTNAS